VLCAAAAPWCSDDDGGRRAAARAARGRPWHAPSGRTSGPAADTAAFGSVARAASRLHPDVDGIRVDSASPSACFDARPAGGRDAGPSDQARHEARRAAVRDLGRRPAPSASRLAVTGREGAACAIQRLGDSRSLRLAPGSAPSARVLQCRTLLGRCTALAHLDSLACSITARLLWPCLQLPRDTAPGLVQVFMFAERHAAYAAKVSVSSTAGCVEGVRVGACRC
jgi:hypothetical protein